MRSASRNGADCSARACARATRPNCGSNVTATMPTRCPFDGPNTAMTASARISDGKALTMSNRISTTRSHRAGREAATMPSTVPPVSASRMADTETSMATVAPCSSRLSRSRPSWSVPSQCAAVGPEKRLSTSSASGS